MYLSQAKSEFLKQFKAFVEYADNHHNSTFLTMRTDNALEFSDSSCQEFYRGKGILHQKSCPYKPQQNSRVERKHRYILETSSALKFQARIV